MRPTVPPSHQCHTFNDFSGLEENRTWWKTSYQNVLQPLAEAACHFIWHQGCELHIIGVKGLAYNKTKPLSPRLTLGRCASDSREYVQKKKKNQWAARANISAAGLGKDTFSIEEKPDRNCICINHRRFSKTIYHLEKKKNLALPPAIRHLGYTVVSDMYTLLSVSSQP